jgi:hypothetical protein
MLKPSMNGDSLLGSKTPKIIIIHFFFPLRLISGYPLLQEDIYDFVKGIGLLIAYK